MNTLFFRKISFWAILSLLLLTIVQCVWGVKMYNDQKNDFMRRVETAAYKTVYKAFKADIIPGLQEADVVQINLDDFSIWFDINLLELDIQEPYMAEVIDLGYNNTAVMLYGSADSLGKHVHSFQIPIDSDSMFALRLTINLPVDRFMGNISGIILSSVAITLLLSFLLLYMIKVIFRQKTLDEMRRDFTHNITHELKTPISTATAATGALLNFPDGIDAARRTRYLEIVHGQLLQLATMVERILSASVAENGYKIRWDKVVIKELVDEVVSQIRMNYTRELDFELDIPENIEIYADPFHLKNILATVVDNAVKYSTCNGDERKIQVRILVCRKRNHIIFSIADNGCGIAKGHLSHIFEKFYRVPQGDIHQTRGYGLGLFYARKVVEQHGGEISATSKVGVGTTVTIKLPDKSI